MEYTIATVAPIVLLPFFAFVLNAFIARRFTKLAVGISIAAIFGSFLYSARIFADFVFGQYSTDYHVHKIFEWFNLNGGGQSFAVNLGIYIDNMTAVMLLMVSGVATLIHLFSAYYMADDKNFGRNGRFFVYLSLFTSAMLGLVLSDNLLLFFIFWELMGFCSYSLIGFYYEKEGAGDASIKAFMTTRVGDVFFLLGILALWSVVGSVSFVDIYSAIAAGKFTNVYSLGIPMATFAGLSIFMGTIGKSAQFPLQVWLPDAMFGPTPCSALIHAATMVAAGVFLSLRIYPLLDLGGLTTFVAYIGGITAFGAATIALIQTDIKAVLAYSTISQLGYMVLGVGVGSYNAAFMHLITHAVFKACLFLAAGSVIHSLHDHHGHGHVQEMPRMGGLKNKMRFTWFAMWCCTLAIAGVPFFSGFVSKDRILGDALVGALHNKALIVPTLLGFMGAFLTAFYMCRMMLMTFHGEVKDKELFDHTHSEKFSFTRNLPLLVLSVFTLGIWYSGSLTGQGLVKVFSEESRFEWFQTLIEKPVIGEGKLEKFKSYNKQPFSFVADSEVFGFEKAKYDRNHGLDEDTAHHVHFIHHIGAGLSIILAFSGLFLAYLMYIRKSINPGWWVSKFSGWNKAIQNKYYFDNLYIGVLIQKGLIPMNALLAKFDLGIYDRYAVDGWAHVARASMIVCKWFDDLFIDTIAVDGVGTSVRFFNVILKTVQSGKVQFYFVVMIFVLTGYIVAIL